MPRRTVLFSPGDRPEMLRTAPTTGADTIVFDLEDAVAPADRPAAREAVRTVMTDPEFDPDCEVCLRVSREREADLDAVLREVASPRLDALVAPKAESPGDVRALESAGLARGVDVPVLALCETARGVLRADAVADAGPTDAVLFGAEDLAADVGAARSRGGVADHARERVLLAARAAGIDAVDAIYADVADAEGLREDARVAADMGYDGKMVVHPDQVDVVHEALTPGEAELAWARRVVAAAADEAGVFRLDDEMIDAPLLARAERLLERAGGPAPGTDEGGGTDLGGDADRG